MENKVDYLVVYSQNSIARFLKKNIFFDNNNT
jgi:hypothetical protein